MEQDAYNNHHAGISPELLMSNLGKFCLSDTNRQQQILTAAKRISTNRFGSWGIPFVLMFSHNSLNANLKDFLGRVFSPEDPTAIWPPYDYTLLMNLTLSIQIIAESEPAVIES